ncbi:MAG TPA: porin, partial [Thioploca sp.]|nr:porin [Thioploca sp.]
AMADTILYGRIHTSVDSLDGASKSTSLSSNTSRIGVKGSMDLDYGLKAIYKAEWGIDSGGDGAYEFKNRDQFVGIAGSFGAILAGRHDTPFKLLTGKVDMFWTKQLGQNRQITNGSGWDLRVNNVLAYQTPKIGNFQALAAYVTEDNNNGVDAISVNGIYDDKTLMFGAGYETHSAEFNGGDGINGIDSSSSARVIAGFSMAGAKVTLFYQGVFDDRGIADNDNDTYGIGLSYGIGTAGTIKAQYYQRSNAGEENNPTLMAAGYDHKLGKNTEVYLQYAQSDKGLGLGGTGHGESMGSDIDGDTTGVSIGLRHKF